MILVRYSHLTIPRLLALVTGPKIHHWTFHGWRFKIFWFSEFFWVFFGREKNFRFFKPTSNKTVGKDKLNHSWNQPLNTVWSKWEYRNCCLFSASVCTWIMKRGTRTCTWYWWRPFMWQVKLLNVAFSQGDEQRWNGACRGWMASDSKKSGQFHLAKDYHKFQINVSADFIKPCLEVSYLYLL